MMQTPQNTNARCVDAGSTWHLRQRVAVVLAKKKMASTVASWRTNFRWKRGSIMPLGAVNYSTRSAVDHRDSPSRTA